MLAPPVGVYRLNRNCDLARGLVFWLPGNTLIDALRHLALTASGGPTQVATDQGRAVNFVTASSQYLVTASSPITAVGFTMACWYNPVSVTNTRDLISIANSGNTTDYFNLQQNSTGAVRVRSADSTTQSSAVTATTATANTWQLAVGVIAATNSRTAYLNGTGKGTSSTSRSTTGVNRIGIGANVGSTPASFFSGNISNVCIWDRVLSDEEIYLLYNPATRWCLYDTSRVFFFRRCYAVQL